MCKQLTGTEEFADTGTRITVYPVGNSQLELVHSPKPDSMVSRWIERRGQGLQAEALEKLLMLHSCSVRGNSEIHCRQL